MIRRKSEVNYQVKAHRLGEQFRLMDLHKITPLVLSMPSPAEALVNHVRIKLKRLENFQLPFLVLKYQNNFYKN